MGIDVKGKNCKLWIKEREGRNGAWKTYSVSVSRKDQSGQYINSYQDVSFTKNVDVSDIPNGTVFDFEGWLTPKTFKDRDGNEVRRTIIMINKASFELSDGYGDSFAEAEGDIPF